MKRTRDLWMALIILLLFWLTRTLAADLYPVFIDETVHIEYGEQMVALQSPIYIDIGRLFTIWWIIPFQPLAGSPVWVARVAIVLASLPGLAALLAVSRKIAGRWGLLLTGVFFIGSSYLTFFGRMALADPIALTPIGIAIWAAYRLRHRFNYRDAILTWCGRCTGTLPSATRPSDSMSAPSTGMTWTSSCRFCARSRRGRPGRS